MGNRIIKESICVSEQIDELSWFEEVFFYRLLVNCDDYGVMDARPKILKARLFPLKDAEDVSSQRCEAALAALIEKGLVRLYEVDGRPYLQVIKWGDHQRVRDSKHKYPAPEEATCGDSRRVAASCGELPQDAENCGSRAQPRAGAESESESESISESVSNARTRARETDDRFNDFWAKYPKKVKKPDAQRAWGKLKPTEELVKQILAGLERWKHGDQWTRDGGRFVPNPATWLNNRQWEDDVQPATGAVLAQSYGQRDYSDVDAALADRQAEEMERFLAGRREGDAS